ncbi:hypothetical protein MRB53_036720 [Persea americana]|nr:hypothetical protein MRB53_036720 [Persea americana]
MPNGSDIMYFNWTSSQDNQLFHVYKHYAELVPNSVREMTHCCGSFCYGPFAPPISGCVYSAYGPFIDWWHKPKAVLMLVSEDGELSPASYPQCNGDIHSPATFQDVSPQIRKMKMEIDKVDIGERGLVALKNIRKVWVQSKLVHIGSAQQREWVRIKRFMWEKQKKDNNSGSGIDFLFCGLVDRPDYTVETLKSAGCQQAARKATNSDPKSKALIALTLGFLSIDCGIREDLNYTDGTTNLFYTSDAKFVDTGKNKEISADYITNDLLRQFRNVRFFPIGTRNCYTLTPVAKSSRYLLRASFMYGDYDDLNKPPQFDVYVGVNLWYVNLPSTADEYWRNEIIFYATTDYISVCLVNIGLGIPYISTLELRALDNSIYQAANESQLLQLYNRNHFRPRGRIRFPDDAYDRVWNPWGGNPWTLINTSSPINLKEDNGYQPPLSVMNTAVIPSKSSENFSFYFPTVNPNESFQYQLFMHFAELELLRSNEIRQFNIFIDGVFAQGPFSPVYLSADTIFIYSALNGLNKHVIDFWKTTTSTLPPILNAVETYILQPLSAPPTDSRDEAGAILLDWDRVSKLLCKGNNPIFRFLDDAYDRVWNPWGENPWTTINTSSPINLREDIGYQPPLPVMNTAVMQSNLSKNFTLRFPTVDSNKSFQYQVFMHFAELEQLQSNQSRQLNIFLDVVHAYGPFSPTYLSVDAISIESSLNGLNVHKTDLCKTTSSTLPPILNAKETFIIQKLSTPTDSKDVNAIMNIKAKYQIKRNWVGDPCVPMNYAWVGVKCSYIDSVPPTIISLDLSSSGLTGELAPCLANLTSIQSLDVSNNSLTGSVPDFLTELSSLKVLNLSKNQFTGSIPTILLEKSKEGSLSLSFDNSAERGGPNRTVINDINPCESGSCKKRRKIVVPVLASVISAVVILTIVAFVLWKYTQRRRKGGLCSALPQKAGLLAMAWFLLLGLMAFTITVHSQPESATGTQQILTIAYGSIRKWLRAGVVCKPILQRWRTQPFLAPPILNAIEIYTVLQRSKTTTNQEDVYAMMNIKKGLTCRNDATDTAKIIALDLSSSGLNGEISSHIANLGSLESLNLSNNSLEGQIPEFLA